MHHLVCQVQKETDNELQAVVKGSLFCTQIKKIVETVPQLVPEIFFFLGWADGTISQMLAPHLRRTEQQLFGGLMTWAWTGSCGRRAWCPSHTTVVFGWRVRSSAKVQKNQPPLVKYNRAAFSHIILFSTTSTPSVSGWSMTVVNNFEKGQKSDKLHQTTARGLRRSGVYWPDVPPGNGQSPPHTDKTCSSEREIKNVSSSNDRPTAPAISTDQLPAVAYLIPVCSSCLRWVGGVESSVYLLC